MENLTVCLGRTTYYLVFVNFIVGGPNVMNDVMREIVDVRDVADALRMVYKKPESSGRYISASNYITTKAMLELLRKARPNYNYVKWWVSYHAFLVCSKWRILFPWFVQLSLFLAAGLMWNITLPSHRPHRKN